MFLHSAPSRQGKERVSLTRLLTVTGTRHDHEPLSAGVVALGLVTLFMDVCSGMIHSLPAACLATVLRASARTVGFVEGIAEGTTAIAMLFSGVLRDPLGGEASIPAAFVFLGGDEYRSNRND